MDRLRILVVGAGAVGCYFAGRLAEHGAEVSLVSRSHYDAFRERGVEVKSIRGDFHFHPQGVYRSAGEFPGTADLIIAAVKVLPEVDLPALIAAAVRPGTAILLIQNGLGIETPVAEAFPDHPLLSAIAYIGVSRDADGRILHQGGGSLKIGRWPTGDSPELERVVSAFRTAGVECDAVDDIEYYRFVKLLWNVPFNTISVLAGKIDTRAMITDPGLEALAYAVMREVVAVAHARGKAVPEAFIEKNVQYTRDFPAYKTSMLLDFEAGRPLEVEAIIGHVTRLGQHHGVAVPHLETLYALLSMADRANRR